MRFDPALLGVSLVPEERGTAVAAWAEAMAAEIGFLYGQLFRDANLGRNLTLLELPNFLPALEHLAVSETPERVVGLATSLESLVSALNRPRALARITGIRTAAAQKLPESSNARFEAERASIEQLMGQARHSEAVRAAQALHLKCEAVGGSAYDGAAYDGAIAQLTLGRALRMGGNAEAALPHLEQARQRFEPLNATRMASVALADKADCLVDLGRYDEAAEAYQRTIEMAEQRGDARSVARNKGQLAAVRMRQKNYPESLRLNAEARAAFERLNEPAMVAVAWQQTGMVYEDAGQYDLAEQAYQKSLNIRVQVGDRAGQASTLNQLGNLNCRIGRPEDAVRLCRQAAEVYAGLGDQRNEGVTRNNIAPGLIELGRFDEARVEIERAIECKKPFGHVALPWTSFAILSNLERAVGNQPAALEARVKAINAYLAYRSDGGAPQLDRSRAVAMVQQDRTAARAAVDNPDVDFAVAAEILLALGESASAP